MQKDDALLKSDLDAVIQAVISGGPLDPLIASRVRERSLQAQKELMFKFGVREIAVDLVREVRDDE
jgi:hypothetical protein